MEQCICKLKRSNFNVLFDKIENLNSFKETFNNFCSFEEMDINRTINFMNNPEYQLEEDEWFKLKIVELENNIKAHIDKIFKIFNNTTEISDISSDKLNNVKLVMYGKKIDDKWKINGQVIFYPKIIREDKFLCWNNGVKVLNDNVIAFKDKIDFIIDDNYIFFKKLSYLNNIHGDFKHLYKAASQKEVKNIFMDKLKDIFVFKKNLIEENKITQNNLKKIKFHKENGIFKKIQERPQDFINYLKKYPLTKDLVEDNKIKIESDNDIKILLKACSQQVYNGDFTNEQFLASGNKKL